MRNNELFQAAEEYIEKMRSKDPYEKEKNRKKLRDLSSEVSKIEYDDKNAIEILQFKLQYYFRIYNSARLASTQKLDFDDYNDINMDNNFVLIERLLNKFELQCNESDNEKFKNQCSAFRLKYQKNLALYAYHRYLFARRNNSACTFGKALLLKKYISGVTQFCQLVLSADDKTYGNSINQIHRFLNSLLIKQYSFTQSPYVESKEYIKKQTQHTELFDLWNTMDETLKKAVAKTQFKQDYISNTSQSHLKKKRKRNQISMPMTGVTAPILISDSSSLDLSSNSPISISSTATSLSMLISRALDVSQQYDIEHKDAKRQLNEESMQIETLRNKNIEMQEQLTLSSQIEKELQAKEEITDKLLLEISNFKDTIPAVENNLKITRSSNQLLDAEILQKSKKFKYEIDDLKKSNGTFASSVGDSIKLVSELELQVANLENELKKNQSDSNEKALMIENLNQALYPLRQCISTGIGKKEPVFKKLEIAQIEFNNLQRKISNLEDKIATEDAQIDRQFKNIEHLNHLIDSENQKISMLIDEKESILKDLQAKQKLIEQSQQHIASLEEAMMIIETQSSDLSNQVRQLEQSIDKERKNINETIKDKSRVKAELKREQKERSNFESELFKLEDSKMQLDVLSDMTMETEEKLIIDLASQRSKAKEAEDQQQETERVSAESKLKFQSVIKTAKIDNDLKESELKVLNKKLEDLERDSKSIIQEMNLSQSGCTLSEYKKRDLEREMQGVLASKNLVLNEHFVLKQLISNLNMDLEKQRNENVKTKDDYTQECTRSLPKLLTPTETKNYKPNLFTTIVRNPPRIKLGLKNTQRLNLVSSSSSSSNSSSNSSLSSSPSPSAGQKDIDN